jgi:CheY-like chemotaxis protein
MPGKDGIQFIEELRKVDKETPVIVITGGNEGEDSDIDQFFNFACYFSNDTLKKPFTQDELYQAMGLALNNRDVDLLNFL